MDSEGLTRCLNNGKSYLFRETLFLILFKLSGLGWKNGSVAKSARCPCRGPSLFPSTHTGCLHSRGSTVSSGLACSCPQMQMHINIFFKLNLRLCYSEGMCWPLAVLDFSLRFNCSKSYIQTFWSLASKMVRW